MRMLVLRWLPPAGLRLLLPLLAGLLAAGCAPHPSGACGRTCPTIESATHIFEYPSQRLVILNRIATHKYLSKHEQLYLVNAILMGGFSQKEADALVTLIRNPCCDPETCDHIRNKLVFTRLLGRDQRRVIEALEQKSNAAPDDAG